MIHFAPFRTPRMTIQLRELTIGESMELCARPAHLHEAATTAMLQCVITANSRPVLGQIDDPRLMTVQERGMLAAHYLAHTCGTPDFAIGTGEARFSQYLLTDIPSASEVEIGELFEDNWKVAPLLGYQAEAIERVIHQGRIPGRRHGWMFGAMACQMRREQEDELQDIADADFDNWLVERVNTLRAFPESAFATLMGAFLDTNRNHLKHLLHARFADEGVVFASEVPGLPSARFPVPDLLSDFTASFLGVATGAGQ